jgi:hypothetical protein
MLLAHTGAAATIIHLTKFIVRLPLFLFELDVDRKCNLH